MREIKFRAWWLYIDCETGKPTKEKKNEGHIDYNPSTLWAERINDSLKSDGSVIFMQYTGLKDKNGKEIYEGDILKCVDFMDYIIWNNDFSSFKFSKDKSAMSLLNWFDHGKYTGFEVIGNIYENPELLEEKK